MYETFVGRVNLTTVKTVPPGYLPIWLELMIVDLLSDHVCGLKLYCARCSQAFNCVPLCMTLVVDVDYLKMLPAKYFFPYVQSAAIYQTLFAPLYLLEPNPEVFSFCFYSIRIWSVTLS